MTIWEFALVLAALVFLAIVCFVYEKKIKKELKKEKWMALAEKSALAIAFLFLSLMFLLMFGFHSYELYLFIMFAFLAGAVGSYITASGKKKEAG